MSKYGGFEQVGSIGSTLPSSDTRITTSPGDIVLYSSNQVVIFYESNTWSYTKLGHINLSKSELKDLLGDENVVITLDLK
jgi:intein-encoded DNA endonuclease-like protein